jgi:hypothetical protein
LVVGAPQRGGRELLPSAKFRRDRGYQDAFERKRAEFAAAGEKAPRKKAIEYFMKEWHAKDESTVEKRVKKKSEPVVEDALMYSPKVPRDASDDTKKTDDDIPF